ncbi:(+)-neomenthol dehydrogenase isoform X4 [Cryptomeria japonica]|uniref:(+)-neomenthol dehydrogenase isoform X4 n=1 Tax=Cryptomeria japonica TaxID=3369 RepID=UPI0027DA9CB0|nr:(+)-neomenthol dehydrogenase isoform X4 [Cryptomeria japonica]
MTSPKSIYLMDYSRIRPSSLLIPSLKKMALFLGQVLTVLKNALHPRRLTSIESSMAANQTAIDIRWMRTLLILRWWKEDTVGVVTGANKGIGYAIVRQLAENGICVILTARDEERGKAAAKTLSDEGFHNVVFHQLDVQDESSIQAFSNWVKEKYGKLDILVNNAGISGLEINYDILKANNTDPTKLITSGGTIEGISESYEKAEECIDINYYGTKRMVEALLPLLKLASEGGGRIVNMTSRAGVLEASNGDLFKENQAGSRTVFAGTIKPGQGRPLSIQYYKARYIIILHIKDTRS